jgi:AbrB family looped-hinge helix DNA binding protein
MKTTVSEKGQITIPKALREKLGIRPGQVLDFSADDRGRLIATKASTRSALDELYGVLNLGKTTDEIMRELRGEREDLVP